MAESNVKLRSEVTKFVLSVYCYGQMDKALKVEVQRLFNLTID